MGGGSARVHPPHQVSVADGLTALLGHAVTVVDGVEVRTRPMPARAGFVTHPETGEPGVQVILYAADGTVIDDRLSVSSTARVGFNDDLDAIVRTVQFRARIDARSEIEFGALGVGRWQLRAGDQVRQLELTTTGTGFAEALLAPPAGSCRVRIDGPTLVEATVSVQPPAPASATADPLAGAGQYGLVAQPATRNREAIVAEAVGAATTADVAVVVVGLTDEQETEAVDKSTLRLPGDQDALITAVAAVARQTVVVVNAATPVLMPWLDQADAVLWAGLPGQEGGHAVAATLLGDLEPTGRLVTTFPDADGAAPA